MLTISVHQTGATLFPGTGFVDEIGTGDARGTSVNLPLPAYTGEGLWLEAFRQVAVPLVDAWAPEILVTQLGCDTHHQDPLANLVLTTHAYAETARMLHELAHRSAGGRWLAMGGGGYQWASVVPRAWTIYFGEMAGVTLPDEIPPEWLERAQREAGQTVPARLSEPPVQGAEGDRRAVEQMLGEVRDLVFPLHGLN